jgi:hypothetical protein
MINKENIYYLLIFFCFLFHIFEIDNKILVFMILDDIVNLKGARTQLLFLK